MKVFYTGKACSEGRQNLLGRYYEIMSTRSLKRIDLHDVEVALSRGEAVLIVPASLTQIRKINALLDNARGKNP